jgi:hypothetical protein
MHQATRHRNVDVVFRFARDSPVEGDGFELSLKIQPKENCGFPGLAIRTIVPQTEAK